MMKVDVVVVIVTLVLCYYHYCAPEKGNCSFGFAKESKAGLDDDEDDTGGGGC